MQLTLQIDDALLAEAARLGALQTPQQLITEALREYLQQRRRLLQDSGQNTSAVSPETEGVKMLKILENRGLLGCMEGDGRLSVDYKKHLWGNE